MFYFSCFTGSTPTISTVWGQVRFGKFGKIWQLGNSAVRPQMIFEKIEVILNVLHR